MRGIRGEGRGEARGGVAVGEVGVWECMGVWGVWEVEMRVEVKVRVVGCGKKVGV